MVVTHFITDNQLQKMPKEVPIGISIRLELNKHGFKFEDDRSPSLIVNTNPIPLGEFTRDYDVKNRRTCYKQVIE